MASPSGETKDHDPTMINLSGTFCITTYQGRSSNSAGRTRLRTRQDHTPTCTAPVSTPAPAAMTPLSFTTDTNRASPSQCTWIQEDCVPPEPPCPSVTRPRPGPRRGSEDTTADPPGSARPGRVRPAHRHRHLHLRLGPRQPRTHPHHGHAPPVAPRHPRPTHPLRTRHLLRQRLHAHPDRQHGHGPAVSLSASSGPRGSNASANSHTRYRPLVRILRSLSVPCFSLNSARQK